MIALSEKWAMTLISQPETGMGYQIATIILKNGKRIKRVRIVGGFITAVDGTPEIPFFEDDISSIVVDHGA